MIRVDDKQLTLPRARGRLVRLSCTFTMCTKFTVFLFPCMFPFSNHEPSTMYLSTSPLQGTSRDHCQTEASMINLVMPPKLEIMRISNFLVSQGLCVILLLIMSLVLCT